MGAGTKSPDPNAVTSGRFSDQTFSASLANEAGRRALRATASGGTPQRHFEAQGLRAPCPAEQSDLLLRQPRRGDGARMSWIQMADT
jgi:hypothetical protein